MLLLALPAVVLAHGALKSSSPVRDATLTRLPPNLVLTFTERVEVGVAKIFLVRDEADTVAISALRSDSGGRSIVADIVGAGGSGTYVVHWLVSGKDGHPVHGTIPFRITGDSGVVDSATTGAQQDSIAAASPEAYSSEASPEPTSEIAGGIYASSGTLHTATRWLGFAAFFALVGSLMTIVPVASALSRQGRSSFAQALSSRACTTALIAVTIFVLADVARLVLQQRSLAGGGEAVAMGAVLATTWGKAWLLRIISSAAAAVAIAFIPRTKAVLRRASLLILMLSAVAIAVGMALSGHAAAAAAPLLPVFYDALHVLAASSWTGTLAMVLLVALPRLQSDPATALIALRTFSAMAVLAVIVLFCTGVLSAWTHLGDFAALTHSVYGKVLLTKLAFVVILVLLGARNRLRVRSDNVSATDAVRAIGRSGRMEIAFALVVLAITAVLVSTPTPPGALH